MIQFIQLKRGAQQLTWTSAVPSFEGNAFLPQDALIPLSFTTERTAIPLIGPGEHVYEGQVIARAADSKAVHVHASVPGVVEGFVDTCLPSGYFFKGVHIRTEGRFDILGKSREPYAWEQVPEDALLQTIEKAGLVNTAGCLVSLAQSIESARNKHITTLTAVLYDKDPTCALDSFLTQHFLPQIVEGLTAAAKALGAQKVIIEIASEKDRARVQTAALRFFGDKKLFVIPVPASYPVENNAVLQAERNAFLVDAVSALNLYESLVNNQPMLTTYVMLTGKAVDHAAVLKVRIGTPIRNIIAECGGLTIPYTHIMLNGLLQGMAVDTADIPVGKGIKSIHAVGSDVSLRTKIEDCGHCGLCLRSCPAYIDPIALVRAVEKGSPDADTLLSLAVCRHCGSCSAVCPARIPLATIIKDAAQKGGFNACTDP